MGFMLLDKVQMATDYTCSYICRNADDGCCKEK